MMSWEFLGRSPELERFGFDSRLKSQKLCCPATTVTPRSPSGPLVDHSIRIPGISSSTPKPTVAVAEKGKVKETKEVRRRSLVMEDLGAGVPKRGCHGRDFLAFLSIS